MSIINEILEVSNPEYCKKLTTEIRKGSSSIRAIATSLHFQDGLAEEVSKIDGDFTSAIGEETWGESYFKERATYQHWVSKYRHHMQDIDINTVFPRFIDTVDLQVTARNAQITKQQKDGQWRMIGGEVQSIINRKIKEMFTTTVGNNVYTINATQNNALGENKMTAEYARFLVQCPDLPIHFVIDTINSIMRGEKDCTINGLALEFTVTEVDFTRNLVGTLCTSDRVEKIAKNRIANTSINENSVPYLNQQRFSLINNDGYNGLYSHTFIDENHTDYAEEIEVDPSYYIGSDDTFVVSTPYHTRVKIYDKFKYNLEVKSVKGGIENAIEYIYNPEYHNLQKAYTCKAVHALGLSRVECTFKYHPHQKSKHFNFGEFELSYLDEQYKNAVHLYCVNQSMKSGYEKFIDCNLRNSVVLLRDNGSDTNVGVALVRAMNPKTGRANGISYNVSGHTPKDAFENLARYCTIGRKPVDLYIVDRYTKYNEITQKAYTENVVVGYAVLPPDATHIASLCLVGRYRASESQLYKNKLLNWQRIGLDNAGQDFYVEPLLRTPRAGDVYSPDTLGKRVTKQTLQRSRKTMKQIQNRYVKRLESLQAKVKTGIVYDNSRYKKWTELKFEEKNCFILGTSKANGRYGEYTLVAVSVKGSTHKWYTANTALKKLAGKLRAGEMILIEKFENTGREYKGHEIWDIDGSVVDVEQVKREMLG